eukprot:gnl/TRDRNA2_/TRDRNA2_158166_c0_seq1.p1 gnl/TRDRNA2_/TRDRNA2_158166_c0~~gnl/TRDRNA2_/TRDRNA2_158166_c0_seq1.p1  ORF type:complete len:343 (-),score=63.97 gnl/TRDRNA2_/TRDRNA2_158166_c0_seq1:36-980(-)
MSPLVFLVMIQGAAVVSADACMEEMGKMEGLTTAGGEVCFPGSRRLAGDNLFLVDMLENGRRLDAHEMPKNMCEDECVGGLEAALAACEGSEMLPAESAEGLKMMVAMCKDPCMKLAMTAGSAKTSGGKACFPDDRRLAGDDLFHVERVENFGRRLGGHVAGAKAMQNMCDPDCKAVMDGMIDACTDSKMFPKESLEPLKLIAPMCADSCAMAVVDVMASGCDESMEKPCDATDDCKPHVCKVMDSCTAENVPAIAGMPMAADDWKEGYTKAVAAVEACPCPVPSAGDTSSSIRTTASGFLVMLLLASVAYMQQ